jgi:hypothetical protein
MLKRLVEKGRISSRSKRASPGQQQLPVAFHFRFNLIAQDWQHIALGFNEPTASVLAIVSEVFGNCAGNIDASVELKNRDILHCC